MNELSVGSMKTGSTARQNQIFRQAATIKENYVIPVVTNTQEGWVMKAFDALVKAVRDIPSVEQVRGQVAGSYLHLVTYMSESTLDQRYQVYDAQMRMYDRFPQLRLEFDVIDRKGYPVQHDELTGKLIEVIRELPDRTPDDEVS